MASNETNARRREARRRLEAREGQSAGQDDRSLAGAALEALLAKVRTRGELTEDEAEQIAADENRRMRAEKRIRGDVGSGYRQR